MGETDNRIILEREVTKENLIFRYGAIKAGEGGGGCTSDSTARTRCGPTRRAQLDTVRDTICGGAYHYPLARL